MTALPRQGDVLARPGTTVIVSQPAGGDRPPPARQPDAARVTAGAIGQHWRTEVLLTLPALPPACDRHAELSTPELADLREATRTDGRDISRAKSAI